MLDRNTTKIVAKLVLVFFVYTFIIFEPLFGAIKLREDIETENKIKNVINQESNFLLPYKYGRVVGGCCLDKDRLVVYIQDLHCNSEVQKNIYEIIKLLDSNFNVEKIFVEGAPKGKVDTRLLSSILDEEVRNKTLDNLLSKGLISGAEYYVVREQRDKLFGIEDWTVYLNNLQRIKNILSNKDKYLPAAVALNKKIDSLKKIYLSKETKRLEKFLSSKDNTNKYYKKIFHLSSKYGLGLNNFPNLLAYIKISELNSSINYKKLNIEMSNYITELRKIIPYSIFAEITNKLKDRAKFEECCVNLYEISREYTPYINTKYPNLSKFFEYINLNYSINPIELTEEKKIFRRELLTKYNSRMVDRELIFLSEMTLLLKNYLDLKITFQELNYFNQNVEEYKLLLNKYFEQEEIAEVINFVDNQEIEKFYKVNIERNKIFKDIVCSSIGVRKEKLETISKKNSNYRAVLNKISDYKEICIVVAGGFHNEVGKLLENEGMSYVAIVPNTTKEEFNDLYERMFKGQLMIRDFLSSAFAPALISLGVNEELIYALVVNLAAVYGIGNVSDYKEKIEQWKKRIVEDESISTEVKEVIGRINVEIKSNLVKVSVNGRNFEFVIENGKIKDFKEKVDKLKLVRKKVLLFLYNLKKLRDTFYRTLQKIIFTRKDKKKRSFKIMFKRNNLLGLEEILQKVANKQIFYEGDVLRVEEFGLSHRLPQLLVSLFSDSSSFEFYTEIAEKSDSMDNFFVSLFKHGKDVSGNYSLIISRLKKFGVDEVKVVDADYLLQEDAGILAIIEVDKMTGSKILYVHKKLLDAINTRSPPQYGMLLRLLVEYNIDSYNALNNPESEIYKKFGEYLSRNGLPRTQESYNKYLKSIRSQQVKIVEFSEHIVKYSLVRNIRWEGNFLGVVGGIILVSGVNFISFWLRVIHEFIHALFVLLSNPYYEFVYLIMPQEALKPSLGLVKFVPWIKVSASSEWNSSAFAMQAFSGHASPVRDFFITNWSEALIHLIAPLFSIVVGFFLLSFIIDVVREYYNLWRERKVISIKGQDLIKIGLGIIGINELVYFLLYVLSSAQFYLWGTPYGDFASGTAGILSELGINVTNIQGSLATVVVGILMFGIGYLFARIIRKLPGLVKKATTLIFSKIEERLGKKLYDEKLYSLIAYLMKNLSSVLILSLFVISFFVMPMIFANANVFMIKFGFIILQGIILSFGVKKIFIMLSGFIDLININKSTHMLETMRIIVKRILGKISRVMIIFGILFSIFNTQLIAREAAYHIISDPKVGYARHASFEEVAKGLILPLPDQSYTGIYVNNEPSKTEPNLVRIYLELEKNTLPVSEYKPSFMGNSPDITFYSMKPWSQVTPINYASEIPENDNKYPWSYELLNDLLYINKGDVLYSQDYMIDAYELVNTHLDLNNFTVSFGKDEQGIYISAYGVWDLVPGKGYYGLGASANVSIFERIKPYLMGVIGKPIHFYDRWYISEEEIRSELERRNRTLDQQPVVESHPVKHQEINKISNMQSSLANLFSGSFKIIDIGWKILLSPITIVHEISHIIAAKIVGEKIGKISGIGEWIGVLVGVKELPIRSSNPVVRYAGVVGTIIFGLFVLSLLGALGSMTAGLLVGAMYLVSSILDAVISLMKNEGDFVKGSLSLSEVLSKHNLKDANFGMIIARIGEQDGVSLESEKLLEVIKKAGIRGIHVLTGQGRAVTDGVATTVDSNLSFSEEVNTRIIGSTFKELALPENERLSGNKIEELLNKKVEEIKESIRRWIRKNDIKVIILENVSTIPMQIPLGIAIKELAEEFEANGEDIIFINHNHDFYWERRRYTEFVSPEIADLMSPKLESAFPVRSKNVIQITINSIANKMLEKRTRKLDYKRTSSVVLPNVMDFTKKAPVIDEWNKDFRKDIGVKEDDIILAQVTRVVERKSIEMAIKLLKMIKEEKIRQGKLEEAGKYKLIITGGDETIEGGEYVRSLISYIGRLGLVIGEDVIFLGDRFGAQRGIKDGHKIYSLNDVYANIDMVTYPSTFEGFGNALIEAIWAKKPVITYPYSVYEADIRKSGIDVLEFPKIGINVDQITSKRLQMILEGGISEVEGTSFGLSKEEVKKLNKLSIIWNQRMRKVVRKVIRILEDKEQRDKIVSRSYARASKYFSYDVLDNILARAIDKFFRDKNKTSLAAGDIVEKKKVLEKKEPLISEPRLSDTKTDSDKKIIEIEVDISHLSEEDKKVLHYVLLAGEALRDVIKRQCPDEMSDLPGKGLYPADLTEEEFRKYCDEHPEERELLESPCTVIKREGSRLVAVPFAVEYREELDRVSFYLKKASSVTKNKYMSKYFSLLAEAILEKDDKKIDKLYKKINKLWLKLIESNAPFLVVLEAGDTYTDELLKMKGVFYIQVFVRNKEYAPVLSIFNTITEKLRKNLEKLKNYKLYVKNQSKSHSLLSKVFKKKKETIILPLDTVVEINFDDSTTLGLNQPADETMDYNSPMIMVNMTRNNFPRFKSIAENFLPEQCNMVDFDSLILLTVLHELGHFFITPTEISEKNLGSYYNIILELVAELHSIYQMHFLYRDGILTKEQIEKMYITFLTCMLRGYSLPVNEDYWRGYNIIIRCLKKNRLLEINDKGQYYLRTDDLEKLHLVVRDLLDEVILLQESGTQDEIRNFIFGDENVQKEEDILVERLANMPKDEISGEKEIVYKTAQEIANMKINEVVVKNKLPANFILVLYKLVLRNILSNSLVVNTTKKIGNICLSDKITYLVSRTMMYVIPRESLKKEGELLTQKMLGEAELGVGVLGVTQVTKTEIDEMKKEGMEITRVGKIVVEVLGKKEVVDVEVVKLGEKAVMVYLVRESLEQEDIYLGRGVLSLIQELVNGRPSVRKNIEAMLGEKLDIAVLKMIGGRAVYALPRMLSDRYENVGQEIVYSFEALPEEQLLAEDEARVLNNYVLGLKVRNEDGKIDLTKVGIILSDIATIEIEEGREKEVRRYEVLRDNFTRVLRRWFSEGLERVLKMQLSRLGEEVERKSWILGDKYRRKKKPKEQRVSLNLGTTIALSSIRSVEGEIDFGVGKLVDIAGVYERNLLPNGIGTVVINVGSSIEDKIVEINWLEEARRLGIKDVERKLGLDILEERSLEEIKLKEMEVARECYAEFVRKTGRSKISFESYVIMLWNKQLNKSVSRVHKLGGKVIIGIDVLDSGLTENTIQGIVDMVRDTGVDGVKLVSRGVGVVDRDLIKLLLVKIKEINKDKIVVLDKVLVEVPRLANIINLGGIVAVPMEKEMQELVREIELLGGKVWLNIEVKEVVNGSTLAEGIEDKVRESGLMGEVISIDLSTVERLNGKDWLNLWSEGIKGLVLSIKDKVERTLDSYYKEWYDIGSRVDVSKVKYNRGFKQLRRVKIAETEIVGVGLQLVIRVLDVVLKDKNVNKDVVLDEIMRHLSEILLESGIGLDSKVSGSIDRLVKMVLWTEDVNQRIIRLTELKGYLEGLLENILYKEYVETTNKKINPEYEREFKKMLVELDSRLIGVGEEIDIVGDNFEQISFEEKMLIVVEYMLNVGLVDEAKQLLIRYKDSAETNLWYLEAIYKYYEKTGQREIVLQFYDSMENIVTRVKSEGIKDEDLAIYYNALSIMEEFSRIMGKRESYETEKREIRERVRNILDARVSLSLVRMLTLSKVDDLLGEHHKRKIVSAVESQDYTELGIVENGVMKPRLFVEYVKAKRNVTVGRSYKEVVRGISLGMNIILNYFNVKGFAPEEVEVSTMNAFKEEKSGKVLCGMLYIIDLLYSEYKFKVDSEADNVRKISLEAMKQLMGAS